MTDEFVFLLWYVLHGSFPLLYYYIITQMLQNCTSKMYQSINLEGGGKKKKKSAIFTSMIFGIIMY